MNTLKTDYSRWRLKNVNGRQTWHYLQQNESIQDWPQTTVDKYFLGLPMNKYSLPRPKQASGAIADGLDFFSSLQLPSGNWACEYGGPMFLLPALVFAWILTETAIPLEYTIEIKNYIRARAHPVDGGWGLHTEDGSTVFGTVMNYTALRLLGDEADDEHMTRARATLHRLGGAVNGPGIAKFWLSILGIVEWDWVNPILPEIWLLPDWVPFAPWRWFVHTRQAFLVMSYIWSKKFVGTTIPSSLVHQLRQELLGESSTCTDWTNYRNSISPLDNSYPKSTLLNFLNWILVSFWIPYFHRFFAQSAEAWVRKLIDAENQSTSYISLGPIHCPLHMIVCYIREGVSSQALKLHRDRLHDFLWMSADGMQMNATNGVQTWDTALLINAVGGAGLVTDSKRKPMLMQALRFLDAQQILDEAPRYSYYRHQRRGAWAFSTKEHGYAVSDCTAEALKAVLHLQKTAGYPALLLDKRIFDAVENLLSYQNSTGGCATYERRRAPEYIEYLNATEVLGRTMVDYDYPECTASVLMALQLFRQHYPEFRAESIQKFATRSRAYLEKSQRSDGSWYGSWGICFTYACMFAIEGLASLGLNYTNSEYVKRGCDFLIKRQRADGGWSEKYQSCYTGHYTEHARGSQVVQTSWAVIALLAGHFPDRDPIDKAVKFIMMRQSISGEWLTESNEGAFNGTGTMNYSNYKFIFPIRALGMFVLRYGDTDASPQSFVGRIGESRDVTVTSLPDIRSRVAYISPISPGTRSISTAG